MTRLCAIFQICSFINYSIEKENRLYFGDNLLSNILVKNPLISDKKIYIIHNRLENYSTIIHMTLISGDYYFSILNDGTASSEYVICSTLLKMYPSNKTKNVSLIGDVFCFVENDTGQKEQDTLQKEY